MCCGWCVHPSSISFESASLEQGQQMKLILSNADATRLCRWPIRWNHSNLFRFAATNSTFQGHDTKPGCADQTSPNSQNVQPNTQNNTRRRSGKRESNRAKSDDSTDGTRSRSRSGHDELLLKSGREDSQAEIGFDEPMLDSETSDDGCGWAALQSLGSPPHQKDPSTWEAGAYILASEDVATPAKLLQLVSRRNDDSWEVLKLDSLRRQTCRVQPAPKHPQGPGFVVRAPKAGRP